MLLLKLGENDESGLGYFALTIFAELKYRDSSICWPMKDFSWGFNLLGKFKIY